MNPGKPLPATAQGTAKPPPVKGQQLGKQATVAQNRSSSDLNRAQAKGFSFSGFLLPVYT